MTPNIEAPIPPEPTVLDLAFQLREFVRTGHRFAQTAKPGIKLLIEALTSTYPKPPTAIRAQGRQTSNSAGRDELVYPPRVGYR
jgi:hypothetical protein